MARDDGKDSAHGETSWYELPYRSLNSVFSWLLPLFFTLLVVAMYILHHFIREAPKVWDFGQVQDIPGKSIYSSDNAIGGEVPLQQQLVPLPGARPLPDNGPSTLVPRGNHE